MLCLLANLYNLVNSYRLLRKEFRGHIPSFLPLGTQMPTLWECLFSGIEDGRVLEYLPYQRPRF